jgi:hypothetical protein
MDSWEAHFRTDEGRLYSATSPVPRAMNFYRSGLYDALTGDGPVTPGLHLVEFFDGSSSDDAILAGFRHRQERTRDGALQYVLRRVGLMAPDPGGIALWTFPSYVLAEPFMRDSHFAGITVSESGLYRNFGDDIP